MKRIFRVVALLPLWVIPSMGSAADDAEVDVVVYAATPCGIAASIMAAREGAAVLLVEPGRHVGGLLTSGLNTAETEHMLPWTIGGFAHEFYQRMGGRYRAEAAEPLTPAGKEAATPAYEFESHIAERVYLEMLREAGVGVRYGAAVSSVLKNGSRIHSLRLTDGSSVPGKVFIDASYGGDVMARTGVSYVVGREGRKEFGEEAAGIRFDHETRRAHTLDGKGNLLPGISGWKKDYREGDADPGVMSYNFRLCVTRDPANRVPFPEPGHYDPSRYELLANWLREGEGNKTIGLGAIVDLYGRRNGKFEMNNKQSAIISLGNPGGQFGWPDGDYDERAAIYDDHLEYTLGLLRFLATEDVVPGRVRGEIGRFGLAADEFADHQNLPYQLYVREGRRMRGRYVVRQQDVQTERRKDDSIGMSSHFIDCHHVQRLAVSPDEFVNEGRIWRIGHAYQIPYRALVPIPGECTNLIVPGAASFTHVAYCTLRLESVWMITGHAAGVAAAMAADADTPVGNVPIGELQGKLEGQKQVIDFIPGQPEKCRRLNGPPEF